MKVLPISTQGPSSSSISPIATAAVLEKAIERLLDVLAHRPVSIVVEAESTERIALQRASAAYAAIDYGIEDSIGTSAVCLGVIGASSDIFHRALAVNDAKFALKEVSMPLQHVRIRVPVKGQAHPTNAIPAIRVVLRNIQRSDLNLLAAYRKIPLLDALPASVTYTRANTRAVHRKSLDDLHTLLANIESPTAAADCARLMILSRRETHLALVREHYQNIRANILYARLDPRGRGRIQISAELALMYAMGAAPSFPKYIFQRRTPAARRGPNVSDNPISPPIPSCKRRRSTDTCDRDYSARAGARRVNSKRNSGSMHGSQIASWKPR